MSRSQSGFTLLEVIVATIVIGAGFAVGLAAMSGSLRLMRSADGYEQAMLLARAAMTEALAYPDTDIAAERKQAIFQGIAYAYRVEFRPLGPAASGGMSAGRPTALAPAAASAPPGTHVSLEQVSVDVYWGRNRRRSYRLVTYMDRGPGSGTSRRQQAGRPEGARAQPATGTALAPQTEAPRPAP